MALFHGKPQEQLPKPSFRNRRAISASHLSVRAVPSPTFQLLPAVGGGRRLGPFPLSSSQYRRPVTEKSGGLPCSASRISVSSSSAVLLFELFFPPIRRRALMNQLLTWAMVKPVRETSICFSSSLGYGFFRWVSYLLRVHVSSLNASR